MTANDLKQATNQMDVAKAELHISDELLVAAKVKLEDLGGMMERLERAYDREKAKNKKTAKKKGSKKT